MAWPVLAVLVSIVSVQAGASLAKQLFPVIGPTGTTTVRLVMGTLILWAVLRPWRVRGTLPWKWLLAYGVTLGTMNTVFYLALQRIPLGIAVAVEFLGPLAVAVIGSRRAIDFVWVALAAAGLLLFVPWDQAQQSLDIIGLLLALLAGACWGMYIVFGQRLGADHGTSMVAYGSLVAMVVAAPWGIASAGTALLAPALLPAALGLGVLSMALPYALEMAALARIPTRTFGLLMSLEPAVAALCGLLFLHERLGVLQWLAIAAIMAASAGATLGARTSARDA
ncbi:EamA family transporter [Pseudoxanthomonas helianthi]|uniref:EamA family transporter n=2 Tax=Pseudoxanthomonas helianthi TaxID=1453541 RepID=A0A940X4C1_9GAMM|nr:EamA family transporter [Pseudoxanthomonas helianthi]